MNKWTALLVISIFILAFFSQVLAIAEEGRFPTRPIGIIHPFQPGGGTDTELRNLAPLLKKYLGQPIIIVPKPGRGTIIGTSYASRAKPDGYTLFSGNVTTGILHQKYHNTDYRLQDFEHIYGWFKGPLDIIVNYDAPFKSLYDLITEGRKRTLKAAAVRLGDLGHLLFTLLENSSGIRVQQIPYGGGGPAIAAVIKGEVDISYALCTTSVLFVKAEKIRALAMFGPRFESLPDVPSVNELGYTEFPYIPLARGAHAPPGTPQDRVKILETAFKLAMDDPEFRSKMEKQGRPVLHITGQELEQIAHDTLELAEEYIPMMKEAVKNKE